MVWIELVSERFFPQTGSAELTLGFHDPLGLAFGLPHVHQALTRDWEGVQPRHWNNLDQVKDVQYSLPYESFVLLCGWWLCLRLAMEEESKDGNCMEIPSARRHRYPVDDWLGWVNAALVRNPATGPVCAANGLGQKVESSFRRCVAAGTHATMVLLMQRLGLNWDRIAPENFPEAAHSVERANRRKMDSGNEIPGNQTLYTRPVCNGSATVVAKQWLAFVAEPFDGFPSQTSGSPCNVHLHWFDGDVSEDPHPFAALLSIFRTHKAPAVCGDTRVANTHGSGTVWGNQPPAYKVNGNAFDAETLGAWLAWPDKSKPKLNTSFQNAWKYGSIDKAGKGPKLLPPLLLYVLAWAASRHIAHICPDWNEQITEEAKSECAATGVGMDEQPANWTLETRAAQLGSAFERYQSLEKIQRKTSRFALGLSDVQPAVINMNLEQATPVTVVRSVWDVAAGWLQGELTAEVDDSDGACPTGEDAGCVVLWLPDTLPDDPHHQAMMDVLDNWAAVGQVSIQTESGVVLMPQGVVTTDWLLLPDALPTEVDDSGCTPLPLRFHTPAPIVSALVAGKLDTEGGHFAVTCKLAWITGAACQRPRLPGEVFVSVAITVPDDWDKRGATSFTA